MKRTSVLLVVSGFLLAAGLAAAAPRPPAADADAKQAAAVKAARSEAQNVRTKLSLSSVQTAKASAAEKAFAAHQRTALSRVGNRLLLAAQGAIKTKKPLDTKAVMSAMTADLKVLGLKDADALTGVVLLAAADAQGRLLEKSAQDADASLAKRQRLRSSIVSVREVLADWGDAKTQTVTWTDAKGNTHTQTMTRAQAEALLAQLEGEYDRGSDASQLMHMDLQKAKNQQQQTMLLLSKIMKDMHDTLKAIIQNMKA